MSMIVDKAVQVTANNLNKTLYQAIQDGDLGSGGGSGPSFPSGGNSGDVLTLDPTLNRVWSPVPKELPTGGTTGQALVKNSNADGDVSWSTISGGGGGGGSASPVEIFNHTVITRGGSTTLTGLNYFIAPTNLTISMVKILLWEKGTVTTGTLSFDLKKNSTPDNVGMTSIFTTQPSVNFATDPNYTSSSGVLSSGAIVAGDFIRLDITSIPASWVGKFTVMVYA